MSPKAQQIAIAEACGWQHRLATLENPVERAGMRLPNSFGPAVEAWWRDGRPENLGVYGEPPRYPTDLNAMHEAEMTLDVTNGGPESGDCLRYAYSRELYKLCPDWIQPFRAPAGMRAEAFLRTIGKWDDSK